MSDGGVGSRLPSSVLVLSGVCTLAAVVISTTSIWLQLKNYRKPTLQRMVVRIMVMVPLYGVSSFIALFSLKAAFFIDAVRDIYEAFVIYCFFTLLLSYLGGERSLLILLHGRPPKDPPFPINFFKREIDVSDPYTFLFLKRGILQYVQVKPVLAVVTMILKALDKYNEGDFRANSGYLYISIIYNLSIFLSLYCLAMFWICVNEDLIPFRPMPKFLCVKGILFFSFWQSIAVSIFVAAGLITKLGPYTDSESISLGLTDCLICVEMPFFAIAHQWAFSHTDFIDPTKAFVARMPFYYAFKDAFGSVDVLEDAKATLRGEKMDYREFEPTEGFMHQGLGRERRIRAGLRYSKGGKKKYWLPELTAAVPPGVMERGVNRAITKVAGRDQGEEVHAPLLQNETEDVVHDAPDMVERDNDELLDVWGVQGAEGGFELPFGDLDEDDEDLFDHCRRYIFGDYNYHVIDASSEDARKVIWDEEERVLRDEHGAWFSPIRGAKGQAAIQSRDRPAWSGYGAVGTTTRSEPKTYVGHRDERVIDHDTERAESSSAGAGDVKMRWTKKDQKENGRNKASGLGSRPSSQSHSPWQGSPRSPPHPKPVSRNNSNNSNSNSQSPSQPKSRTPLPPDAVDLVVENPEQPRHLQKVYRRGIAGPEGEEAEIEVDDPQSAEAGEEIAEAAEDADDVEEVVENIENVEDKLGVPDRELATGVVGDGQEQVAVVEPVTPPAHARVYTEDDNPWA